MISREEVLKIAALARLELSEQEIERMRKDLDQMLEYVKRLEDVDVSNVEPFSFAGDRGRGLREDLIEPSLPVEEALNNAPEREADYFKVPPVVER